jgi:hypothetical protein
VKESRGFIRLPKGPEHKKLKSCALLSELLMPVFDYIEKKSHEEKKP